MVVSRVTAVDPDTDTLVDPGKWSRVVTLWWVASYPDGTNGVGSSWAGCSWARWVWSTTAPPPVPNRRMTWRHPTYQEAVVRQRVYLDDPDLYAEVASGRQVGAAWVEARS